MSTAGRPDRQPWRNVDADVDEELAFHLEMRARDARERGLSPEAASLEAHRRFGDVDRIRREVVAVDHQAARDRRRASMWQDFGQDVRYALRGMRRAPGFTAVALLTLALGIGANSAIFNVVNAVMLRPLPFADAGRLVFLWDRQPPGGPEPLGPVRMLDFRAQATSFSGLAGISHISYTLTGAGDPEVIPGASVSSAFFDVLGVRPLFGDTFHEGAVDPDSVVLTYPLWAGRFNADPAIVGRRITLNGRGRTVAAILPQGFVWPFITARPNADGGPALFVPGGPGDIPRPASDENRDMRGSRNAGYLRAVARLAPGVSFGQADAEVRGIGERLARTYREDDGRSAMLVPARQQFYGVMEQPLFVLGAAVAFVLAIACANVASLLLARGAARRRDLALRRALGASRLRVARQLLTESIVLAAAGGACGVLLGWAGTGALLRLAPGDIAGLAVAPDWRVLVFTAFVALCAGMAFGIVPALQSSRDDLTSALAEGSTRTAGSRRAVRVRDYLVGGEVAVALVLLVGALLLVRSFVGLTRVDTGIDTRNLLTFSIHLTGERASDQAYQVQFYADLQNRLAALPGVTAAGSAVTLPIGGDNFGASFLVEGQPVPTEGNEPHAGYQVVMPGYFAAMGIPIDRGRDFTAADDRRAAPVVLVNETLARQQWPGGEAVGRRVRFGSEQPWATVVGVVRDIRHLGPSEPPRPEIYQPAPQRSFSFMAFVVRTSGDPHAIVPSVRRAVAALDPTLAIADVRTMDEHVARALARPRFMSTLITSFSALALLLAIIGIHGVLAWSVAQQHQEIAIRMALGAASTSVLVMVLRRAALLGAAGIAAGLALAPLAARPLGSMLYGLAPWDPASLAAAAALLGFVTLLAALVPAARASRIQPGSLVKL